MTQQSANQRIADLIVGHELQNSRLRAGILELFFDGNLTLMVYVPGQKLGLKLLTPNGIIEEGLE